MRMLLVVLVLAATAYGSRLQLAPLYTNPRPIPGQFLVKLKNVLVSADEFLVDIQLEEKGKVSSPFNHLEVLDKMHSRTGDIIVMGLDYQSLQRVRKSNLVEYVEENGVAQYETSMNSEKREASIDPELVDHLDRINQREGALDGNDTIKGNGFGVNVYIVDSGIRELHRDFECRAVLAADVFGAGGEDCTGHGTEVAALAVGKTAGVATGAFIHSVRVTDCDNAPTVENYVKGIEWVTTYRTTPCVVILTISSGVSKSIDDAVEGLAASECVIVAAAGNTENIDEQDACLKSPGRSSFVITTASAGFEDRKPDWSNSGLCVDIFAPGENIYTASSASNDYYVYKNGTSLSAGIVAGVAAIHLANNVAAADVKKRILTDATACMVYNEGPGSPNRMLYTEPGLEDNAVLY